MTDRELQLRLDQQSQQYLDALTAGRHDLLDEFWLQAETDPDLAQMLHDLHAELVAEQGLDQEVALGAAVVEQIARHMPSAEWIEDQPVTLGDVADYLRRHPTPGLGADDWRFNETLQANTSIVPDQLGLSQILTWGGTLGVASETYWRAFRQAALKLQWQRESAGEFRMAARSSRPKPAEGTP